MFLLKGCHHFSCSAPWRRFSRSERWFAAHHEGVLMRAPCSAYLFLGIKPCGIFHLFAEQERPFCCCRSSSPYLFLQLTNEWPSLYLLYTDYALFILAPDYLPPFSFLFPRSPLSFHMLFLSALLFLCPPAEALGTQPWTCDPAARVSSVLGTQFSAPPTMKGAAQSSRCHMSLRFSG